MSHFNKTLSALLALTLGADAAFADRGDVDADGQLTVLDIQRTVNGILRGAPATGAGDIDRDGRVDIRDVQHAANGILRRTPLVFDAPRRAAAPGDFVAVGGQGFDQVEAVRLGDQPAEFFVEGPNQLAFRVPNGVQGDVPLTLIHDGRAGPPLDFRVLCGDCQSPFPHQIRWPAEGAPVAGPTFLILASPDFGRDDARPVEAWIELDQQAQPVPLIGLNGVGPASHPTQYLMHLPDVYQVGTLVVVLADSQGRIDLLQRELEVFPAPSFLPEHEALPGQAGVQLTLPPGVQDALIVAVSLDTGERYQDLSDAQVGAWIGLPPGDYLFYAEAMGRPGLLSASATGRIEHDSPARIQLDLGQSQPLPMDPAQPRVVGIASRPLTRRPGAEVILQAITSQPMGNPAYEWTVDGEAFEAGAQVSVQLGDEPLNVQVRAAFGAPFATSLSLARLPGAPDRDASPLAHDAPNTDYEAFDCGQVFAAMERTEFAGERAANAFAAWAEGLVERADCTAFVGWAEDPADFEPVAWLDGELPITELCVADAVCGGCEPFGAEQIEGNRAGSFEGICGVLSVAHSLVYKLGVVDADDAMIDTDGDGTADTWKQDFLNRIRQKSGHVAETGTTVSGEQDAYEDFDNGEDYDIECGGEQEQDDYDWDSGTIDADELKAWCEGLDKQADDDDEDCTFIIRGETSAANDAGSGNYAGHAMHIKSVAWDDAAGKCIIETVNTGKQSSSNNGDDVPVNPGSQTWHITRAGGADLNVFVQAGSSSYSFFRNKFVWNKARSYCCKVDD